MESLKLTVNHVARLERLLSMLSPEEQLVLDCMLVNPYKRCTVDLMEHITQGTVFCVPRKTQGTVLCVVTIRRTHQRRTHQRYLPSRRNVPA